MLNRVQTFSRWLLLAMASLILAACGSGDGDNVLPVQGVSNFSIAGSISNSIVAPSATATVTARLSTPLSTAAAGQTVRFELTGPGSLSSDSATTNASGDAVVVLSGATLAADAPNVGNIRIVYTDSNNNIAQTNVGYRIVDGNSILLSAAKPSVKTGAGDSVQLTAFVTDSTGGAVQNATVRFNVGAISNGTLDSSTAVTDSFGKASVTFSPSSTDRSNKTVTVSASTGVGATLTSDTTTIDVTGTVIELTAPQTSLVLGASTTVTATLKDGSGTAIPGQTLTFIGAPAANVPAGSTFTTNAAGQASLTTTITSQVGAAATISASSLGASSSLTFNVSSENFTLTTPAQVNTGTTSTVTLTFTNGGAGVANQTVFFSSTLGSISPTSTMTNASGIATASITSNFAGQAVINVNTAGNAKQASNNVLYVARTPAQITAQPAATSVNPGQQTEIVARVRDTRNNPVLGSIVEFSLLLNDSGGSLSAATATTDASGNARVTFTAGLDAGAQNGTEIIAKVQGTSVTTDTVPADDTDSDTNAVLTVGGQSAFVAVSSGNSVIELNPSTYAVPHNVIVTTSTGQPAINQDVVIRVVPVEYYKGEYVFDLVRNWITVNYNTRPVDPITLEPVEGPVKACSNEDLDLDGTLDFTENNGAGSPMPPSNYPGLGDVEDNGDGILWPGLPVTLSSGTVRTDSTGLATFNVIYGQGFANWVKIKLVASTLVQGSESKAERLFVLPALAEDLNKSDVMPPGGPLGPFGQGGNCSNVN